MTNIITIEPGPKGFAQNKDYARDLRRAKILPLAESGEPFGIDFSAVHLSTQSFVHALISEPLRKAGPALLERMDLKGCNKIVRELILTVVDYSLNPDVDPALLTASAEEE